MLGLLGCVWFPLVSFGRSGFGIPCLLYLIKCFLFHCDMGVGQDLYIVEGANPGFIYQVEAFDPEDTSQNIPLSVSLLVKMEKGFSTLLLIQEPGILAGWT